MAALSEWLQLMLGEIARKRDDLEHAHEEETKRVGESAAPHTSLSPSNDAVLEFARLEKKA